MINEVRPGPSWVGKAMPDRTTERETLLIQAMWETVCPYRFRLPLEGNYGPMTCGSDCYEEPGCEQFEAMEELEADHPDLFERIVFCIAETQLGLESVYMNLDHPLHDWVAARDPDYAKYLANHKCLANQRKPQ